MNYRLLSLLLASVLVLAGCGQPAFDESNSASENENNIAEEKSLTPLDSVNIVINTQSITYTSTKTGLSHPLFYDLPTVSGDAGQISRMNEAFGNDFEMFSKASGRHAPLYIYVNGEEKMDPQFLPGEVTARVVQNSNGILSVEYSAHYLYDYNCVYGMNFDLATGKQVSITDCFPLTAEALESVIREKLQSLINDSNDPTLASVLEEYLAGFDLEKVEYVVREGELVVFSPQVQYPDGACMTYDIPCGVMLDGSIVDRDSKKTRALLAYLGMTVEEFTALWGTDYLQNESWFLGGLYGFEYEDERIQGVFFIDDPNLTGEILPSDTICAIMTGDTEDMLTESIPCRITYEHLLELGLDGESSVIEGGDLWEYTYTCSLDNSAEEIFGWDDGFGDGYPGIFLYQKGLLGSGENEPANTANDSSTNGSGASAQKDAFLRRAEEIEIYSEQHYENAMSQAEINAEAYEVYSQWDALLNEVYQYLKDTLPNDRFNALKLEQIAWIQEKESAVETAAAEWSGGSGEPMARYSTAADYTMERCFRLIEMIDG